MKPIISYLTITFVSLPFVATQVSAQDVLPFPEPGQASTTGKTLKDSKHQSNPPTYSDRTTSFVSATRPWSNFPGRTKGLKIPRSKDHTGSTPVPGTNNINKIKPFLGSMTTPKQASEVSVSESGPGCPAELYERAGVVRLTRI